MKNTNARSFINKVMQAASCDSFSLSKESALPTPLRFPLEGAGSFSKRVGSGVVFKTFDANKLKQELSNLPEEIKNSLASKIESYKKGFETYLRPEERERFSGMMKIVYAYDTNFTPDTMSEIAKYDLINRTTLRKTADFCKTYNIQLTPFNTQREIGSEDWLKIFGYAYAQEGYEVEQVENARKREIGPNKTGKEFDNSINGRFVVAHVGNGYTFAIERDDSRYIVFDENGRIFRDAENNPVKDRTLTIIFEPGAQIAEQMQRKYFRTNITINRSCVLFDRDRGMLEQVDCAAIKQLQDTNPQLADKIYKIYADKDTGAFFVQKNKFYSGGRMKPEANRVGPAIYLTKEEVESLVAPNTLNSLWSVKSAKAAYGADARPMLEIRENYKYIYDWKPTAIKRIQTTDTNSEDYPYSITAIKQLKRYLDQKMKMRTGDDRAEAHTAFEGYKIYMIAPEFVMGKNISDAATRSSSKTLLPRYEAVGDDPLAAERTSWLVLYMNIAPMRMQIAGRTTASGKLVLPNFVRQTTQRFDNLADAISYLRSFVTIDSSAVAELQHLSTKSRGVELSQRALERSRGDAQNVAVDRGEMAQKSVVKNIAGNEPSAETTTKPRMRLVDGRLVPVDEQKKDASVVLIRKILGRHF